MGPQGIGGGQGPTGLGQQGIDPSSSAIQFPGGQFVTGSTPSGITFGFEGGDIGGAVGGEPTSGCLGLENLHANMQNLNIQQINPDETGLQHGLPVEQNLSMIPTPAQQRDIAIRQAQIATAQQQQQIELDHKAYVLEQLMILRGVADAGPGVCVCNEL